MYSTSVSNGAKKSASLQDANAKGDCFKEIFSIMCVFQDKFSSMYTLTDFISTFSLLNRAYTESTQLLPGSEQHKLSLRLIESEFICN